MNAAQSYIIISILVIAIIGLFVFFKRKDKPEKKLIPLASLAIAFILAGILLGDSRLVGYNLMGVGVVLAVVDMILKLKNKGAKSTQATLHSHSFFPSSFRLLMATYLLS